MNGWKVVSMQGSVCIKQGIVIATQSSLAHHTLGT